MKYERVANPSARGWTAIRIPRTLGEFIGISIYNGTVNASKKVDEKKHWPQRSSPLEIIRARKTDSTSQQRPDVRAPQKPDSPLCPSAATMSRVRGSCISWPLIAADYGCASPPRSERSRACLRGGTGNIGLLKHPHPPHESRFAMPIRSRPPVNNLQRVCVPPGFANSEYCATIRVSLRNQFRSITPKPAPAPIRIHRKIGCYRRCLPSALWFPG